jgi:hypothetical protein
MDHYVAGLMATLGIASGIGIAVLLYRWRYRAIRVAFLAIPVVISLALLLVALYPGLSPIKRSRTYTIELPDKRQVEIVATSEAEAIEKARSMRTYTIELPDKRQVEIVATSEAEAIENARSLYPSVRHLMPAGGK